MKKDQEVFGKGFLFSAYNGLGNSENVLFNLR